MLPSQSLLAKRICLRLQNVLVSNFQIYLSQIAKCVCLKFQNVFVSNCGTSRRTPPLNNMLPGLSLPAQTSDPQLTVKRIKLNFNGLAKKKVVLLKFMKMIKFIVHSFVIAIQFGGEKVQYWESEVGTNCVMKIGGLRARGRKFFLLCDRGIFFMQFFYNICYY